MLLPSPPSYVGIIYHRDLGFGGSILIMMCRPVRVVRREGSPTPRYANANANVNATNPRLPIPGLVCSSPLSDQDKTNVRGWGICIGFRKILLFERSPPPPRALLRRRLVCVCESVIFALHFWFWLRARVHGEVVACVQALASSRSAGVAAE